jgi:hypothetical protein
MQRRELLTIAALGVALGAGNAVAQTGQAPARARLVRIYSKPNGDSGVEELEIAPNAGPIPVTQMTAGVYGGAARPPAWHLAPRKQFAINMTGDLEVEVTGGARRKIGAGDLVFLEDVTGQGHVTRALGPITNLFIHVADSFDVVAWARGSA